MNDNIMANRMFGVSYINAKFDPLRLSVASTKEIIILVDDRVVAYHINEAFVPLGSTFRVEGHGDILHWSEIDMENHKPNNEILYDAIAKLPRYKVGMRIPGLFLPERPTAVEDYSGTLLDRDQVLNLIKQFKETNE